MRDWRVCCVTVMVVLFISRTVHGQEPPSFDADPCVKDVNTQPDANGNVATVFWAFPTAKDATGNPAAVTCDQDNGGIFNEISTLVTCTAVDTTTSLTATCSFSVNVYPTFATGCPSNIIIETSVQVTFDLPTANVDSGGGSPTVTCTPASGEIFTEPETEVTCKAADTVLTDQEVSCTFLVTVGAIPVFDHEGYCADPSSIDVAPDEGLNTASEISWNKPTVIGATVTCDPDPDTVVFEGGETVLTCMATDDTTPTLISTCSFTVHVYPTFATGCPSDIIIETSGQVTFDLPTANVDSDGETPIVTCTLASEETFNETETEVTCKAADTILTDQEVSCTFIVTVGAIPVFDDEGSCADPSSIDVAPDEGLNTASGIQWTKPTVTGATVTCDPDPDTAVFKGGETVVTCMATNDTTPTLISTCNFIVRVFPAFDNNACVPNILRQPDTGGMNAKIAWINPPAIDKTGAVATVTCSPESGSSFTGLETDVNCMATDGTNTTTCKFKVSVRPHFSKGCPDDKVVPPADEPTTAVDFDAPEAPDDFIVNCTSDSGDEFVNGVTSVNCTVTDLYSKLEGSCSFKITVGVEPSFNQSCPAEDILVAANPDEEMVISWDQPTGNNDSTGNPAEVKCNYNSGDAFNQTETEVRCVVTDAENHLTNECSFKVILDSVGPTFDNGCPGDADVNANSNSSTAVYTWPSPAVWDEYTDTSDIQVRCIPANNSIFLYGITTVFCLAIDSVGNMGECNFTVTVIGTACEPECSANSTCILTDTGVSECICIEGYLLNASGDGQCSNKNECELDKPCHINAECTDLEPPKLFSCSCKDGFYGDGVYSCSSSPPVFPEIEYSGSLEKRFSVEIGVTDSSASMCDPVDDTQSADCIVLVTTFKNIIKPFYEQVSSESFVRIDVNQKNIRKGSVIIPHNVVYDYTNPGIRSVDVNEFWGKSVKAAVDSGVLGSLMIEKNCTNCSAPVERTNLCDNNLKPTCPDKYELNKETTSDGCIFKCLSTCESDSDYCNDGTCSQEPGKAPVCSDCPSGTEEATCEPVEELNLPLIIGLSVGLGVPALLLIIGIIVYCVHKSGKKSKVTVTEEEGQSNEALAMENTGT